jgi:hypothetical protein
VVKITAKQDSGMKKSAVGDTADWGPRLGDKSFRFAVHAQIFLRFVFVLHYAFGFSVILFPQAHTLPGQGVFSIAHPIVVAALSDSEFRFHAHLPEFQSPARLKKGFLSESVGYARNVSG